MSESETTTKVTEAEESARRSRLGYEYQDLVAVSYCLKMLEDESLLKVECETQDDIVLTWSQENSSNYTEFIQVKSDRNRQQWSISQFCEQDTAKKEGIKYRKDTSIFEKNALRDQSHYTAIFSIITRADVNNLRLLTIEHSKRSGVAVKALADNIESQLKGNTSLTTQDIEYWVNHAMWVVKGTDSAVFNSNFHNLGKVIEASYSRLLSTVELERILQLLAIETKLMATGRGRCGNDPSSMSSKEMRLWLDSKVKEIPHILVRKQTKILIKEERRSLARCKMLWLALGVSEADAAALARQPEIGAREEFFSTLSNGFHWITADYGAGKSLSVERLFQTQLAEYLSNRDSRVPIFIRASNIKGLLQDIVNSYLRDLDLDSESSTLFVIIDAADEAGTNNAHRILQDAYELSATFDDSSVIVTSIQLPCELSDFKKELPKLSDTQSAHIVSQFAQYKIHPFQVKERLGEDNGIALMCVLLGLALRDVLDATPSKGQLLHSVVDAARKRNISDAGNWAECAELLHRVAKLSTDKGGGAISFVELTISSIESTPLITSRLIIEVEEKLVFTVATMRLWFAAQALSKGVVDVDELINNLALLRNWIDPLAIFIATTDFGSATKYMKPIASHHPAIAAQVISKATSRWGNGSGLAPSESSLFASKVRNCLNGWIGGIGVLSKAFSFTDEEGKLLKIKVGATASKIVITFDDAPDLPLTSALPLNPYDGAYRSVHIYSAPDEPSHIWRQTHNMVCNDLIRTVKLQNWALAEDTLIYEEIWHHLINFSRTSRWFTKQISWDRVKMFKPHFIGKGLWKFISEMRENEPLALSSPHPPADIRNSSNVWISSFYSAEAALAYAVSVYTMALSAYQQIVKQYFPCFKHDFNHSAWWPCKLIGEVSRLDDDSANANWWITYWCEAVEFEKDAGVSFQLGSDPDFAIPTNTDEVMEEVKRLHPESSPWFWVKNQRLNFNETSPATAIVQEWLTEDLSSCGWGK